MGEQRVCTDKNEGHRAVSSLPTPMEHDANCTHDVTDAVLELNRELVAQNIWLRGQLASMENQQNVADEKLMLENEQLRRRVFELEKKLEKKQDIALLSAKVIASRIAYRDNQQFVEYKVQLETDCRGTLFVWHRYSTFRKLAESLQAKQGHSKKSVPELPSKQLFGNFSNRIIQERVIKLNEFLDAATNGEHLQWGIRVDADTCVYKRRKRLTTTPCSSLKTKDWVLPSRTSEVHHYAVVAVAKVVDSRIQDRAERPFIEYQFKVKTDTGNTLLVWHRYSSLHDWAELTQRENPCIRIPQLPNEEPFGSFSKHIRNDTEKLNTFAKQLVKSDNLQWVVKVDENNVFVSKLRVKVAASACSSHEHDLNIINPLSSVSNLFPLKSMIQRQRDIMPKEAKCQRV